MTAVVVGEVEEQPRELTDEQKAILEQANDLIRQAYTLLDDVFTEPMPVGRVQWIHIDKVQANDYNPNAVAHQEMKLLHTSISEDGYTQPVVAISDPDTDKHVIVDGYHRYTVMRRYADIHASTGGYLPVVVIDKPIADRIASTVRHNRARGKHSVAGMGSLVFQMLNAGEDDATICNKLGLEAEELSRLKHITGYSKLYADSEYSTVVMSKTQAEAKAAYGREHDEKIPEF
jgi:ParB-like chromosome segregation protein Spo0J